MVRAIVYNYTDYDTITEKWGTTPAGATDGDLGTKAYTATANLVHRLTATNHHTSICVRHWTTLSAASVYATQRMGTCFIAGGAIAVNELKLYCHRLGSPGVITATIYAVDGSHYPTGAALSVGTLNCDGIGTTSAWVTWSMSVWTPTADTEYCIIVTGTGNSSNALHIEYADNQKANWAKVYSTNDGAAWTYDATYDLIFELGHTDEPDLGTITKVELRSRSSTTNYNHHRIELRPVFVAGDGTNHIVASQTTANWDAWIDITADTNAPGTWAWTDVVALDVDAVSVIPVMAWGVSLYEAELAVTYDETPPDIVITPAPATMAWGTASPAIAGTVGATINAEHHSGPSADRASLSVIASSSYTGTVASENLTPRISPPTFGSKVPGGDNVLEFSLGCDRYEALMWKRQREKRWWVTVYDSLGVTVWRGRLWVCAVTESGVDMRAYGAWHILSSGETPYNQHFSQARYETGADWAWTASGVNMADGSSASQLRIQSEPQAVNDWGSLGMAAFWPFDGMIRQVKCHLHKDALGGSSRLRIWAVKVGFSFAVVSGLPNSAASTYELILDTSADPIDADQTMNVTTLDKNSLYIHHLLTNSDADIGHSTILSLDIRTQQGRDTDDLVLDVTQKVGGVISDSAYYIQASGVELPFSQVYEADDKGADIIVEMCRLGNSSNVPMYAGVFADLYMRFWPRKSTVTWRTRLSELVPGSFTLANDEELWTACYAVYTTVAGATARTSTTNNPSMVTMYGTRTKALTVTVKGNVDADRLTQAEQFRDTFLALNARPVVVAKFNINGRVWDAAWNERPLWHVLAGDILEVPELREMDWSATVVPDGTSSFHLIEVSYDAGSKVLSCTPEGGRPELDVQMAKASL